jgi:hypothetical protein
MGNKAYLASPFFTEKELVFYHKVIDYLRHEEGFDLYVPMFLWNIPLKVRGI